MTRSFKSLILLFLLTTACIPLQTSTMYSSDEDSTPIQPPDQSPTPYTNISPPTFNKWTLWNSGTMLRGVNVYQRRIYHELDGPSFMGPGLIGPPYTQDDFDDLSELGANYVNISHPGLFTEESPYEIDKVVKDNLDTLLAMISKADMFAVISFRTGPGRSEFTFFHEDDDDWFDESYINEDVWKEQDAQDAWVSMWRYTAEHYRNNPIVVGYDLMVEPNSNEVWVDEWDPEIFYQFYKGTLYDWNQLHPRISAAIREVDPDTPILVGGMAYSAIEWLPYLEPSEDSRIVYTAHQYAPFQYTHQWWETIQFGYPDFFDTNWDGKQEIFDRSWLETLLSDVDDYKEKHAVPVAVNEFGVMRWIPDATIYLTDLMDLFEERGLNYALWLWESSWQPYAEEVDAFDFTKGTDPRNKERQTPNELLDLLQSYWSHNTARPSQFLLEAEHLPILTKVSHWLYLIDVNLEEEILQKIIQSTHNMVVLDFIPSESNNKDYPMADVINRLHHASPPKLVLAYIDIGEAESYRTYWKPDWQIGDPVWILGEDPDGWEENYPIAFWYDAWQEIWLAENGILKQILDAGFDGVYLDWVEAYSDERVLALANKEGVDPIQEMIWWVGDISNFLKSRCADCVVISQNAAELVEYEDYLDTIDAISQEQIWFDGGADNDPQGDCPLPRTIAEIDSHDYRDSLSTTCRRQYDRYPDGTLHTSSEEYLHHLELAKKQGLTIFTVDYALEPENIAFIYKTSRAMGFIPFVSNRALNQYIEPYP